jgi:hypothetical protein
MSSFVYWIKHKDHTDINTEGYVGITSGSVKRRYSTHLRVAKKLKNGEKQKASSIGIVHRAMVKYGDDIELVVLCECDLDYARWLENKLRPAPLIGWNICVGGGLNGRLGRPQTDKQKSVVSAMRRGIPVDTSHMVEKLKNRDVPETERVARSEVMKSFSLINSPYSNKDVLSLANDIYHLYKKGYKHYRISNALNLNRSTNYKALFRRFSEGYDPTQDSELQDFIYHYLVRFGKYDKTKPARYTKTEAMNVHLNKKGHYVAYKMMCGNKKRKTFNVYRLGEEEAFRQATEWVKSQQNENST